MSHLIEDCKRHTLHCVLVNQFDQFHSDLSLIDAKAIAEKINKAFDCLADNQSDDSVDKTDDCQIVEFKVPVEVIARVAHEVNAAYCRSHNDHSQTDWDHAPQWQKDSAINGVKFHLEGEHDPEESHVNWMAQKKAEGWKYGDVKDADKKEHPCMVPYNELPQEQRVKDHLFLAVVNAFK